MARQVRATEEWVREKAELSSVRPDEVETLSLHGSYHEKIVSLGNSLLNFKSLKSLDLSRNAIVSLEGLESLQELEQLSLYFNNIQTLEQISSLRHLTHLTELDLRLNPVTSTERNYRPYVIGLLPNLLKLDLRPVRATERNPAQFEFLSHAQYEKSETDKTEESQQMKKLFSNDANEQSYLNGEQMYEWNGAANIQSDLRPVPATERNATKYGFISQKQYETSEVDKREESQHTKMIFRYETDQHNYVNQSDVRTTSTDRSCSRFDEDDSTSIRRSGMLSTSQIPHNPTSTAHHLVDEQQLLSPSNSLTSLRAACSRRSFIDRKENEHSRNEQNKIHPSEDVRTTSNDRSCSRIDEHDSTSIRKSGMLSTSQIPQYPTSTAHHLVDGEHLLSPSNSLTSLHTTVSKRNFTDRKETEHIRTEQNQIHPSEDVKTTSTDRRCSRIEEDDSTSIRSGKLSTCQISRNGTSTAHLLVDRQKLSPSNSLTPLHTICSRRSFTDRKENEHSRNEQNQIHPSEDVRTATKSRSCSRIDEDDSTSIRRSGMLSTSQILHNPTSTAHHLVDREHLLSPSNSLTFLHTACSKRSFTDRKETEHLRREQNKIHPCEDVRTTSNDRSCSRIDEHDSTSIRKSGMLSTSQIPHYPTSTAHHLVDGEHLLSPSNSLTSFHTTVSKRSFTDRKETEHIRTEQNQIHPSEDVRTTSTDRRCSRIEEDDSASIRSGKLSTCQISRNGTSTAHLLVDRQKLSPSNFLTSLHTTCSRRSFTDRKENEHSRNEQNQIHPSEDVTTATKSRSCSRIDEDDSTSIRRSGVLSTSQILHNPTSTAHHLVDREHLLSPSNSLTSLHTACSKRSFTDRKETEHLRREQNKIHPSEDVRTTSNDRSCSRIDEHDSTSIRKSGMLSTSQIPHYPTSTAHHLVDGEHLLSPSNSLTSLHTTVSKRSFTDRKETEHIRTEQNQIHPSEAVRTTSNYRRCRRIEEDDSTSIRSGKLSTCQISRNGTSTAHLLVDRQKLSPSNSLTSLRTTCSRRSFTDRKETVHLQSEQNQIHPSEDVRTASDERRCKSIDEHDSTSIRRSGILSTSQIPHNPTSTAHHLVDGEHLLSPSNSLTSLHTTCSKRSFTDRKETEYLRSKQNQIHPVEDDYRNYQLPVRSSFRSAMKNVSNQSRKELRVTFSDEIPIKHNKISSRSIPEDDSASCLESRMPSTSQMPHQQTSSCDQQNRTSASFTEHVNTEITDSKSSEAQLKLTRAQMEYFDKRLEATKTTSLNSLQQSYKGKTAHHKLPGRDQCGDSNPEIPLGLRSGSSANVSPHLQNLLDLVDQHWSGSKSLHKNQTFLNSAEELFLNVLDRTAFSKIQGLEQSVNELTEESRRLRTRTTSGFDSAEFLRIKRELNQKEDDLESLKGNFAKLMEENNKLHSQLRSLELVNSAGLQQRNEELHRENDRLNLQVKYLNQQIEQHNKLKDVVTLLQESHRTIISSNDYLKKLLNTALQRSGISNVLSKDLSRKL